MKKFIDLFFSCINLKCRKNQKAIQCEANNGIDFVNYLNEDVVYTIFSYLDDVEDIHCARAVSRLWNHHVLSNANDLYHSLCLKKAPGMCKISYMLGKFDSYVCVYDSGTITSKFLEVEDTHKVYSSLLRALSISTKYPQNCLMCVLGSSSTKSHPEQSVVHIVRPETTVFVSHDSYWSSKGVTDSKTNESIVLMLDSSVCIITEIGIHPFKAFLEPGSPIYSPRFVRFKMGHPRLKENEREDFWNLPWLELNDDKYVWTYTSQEFPVIQDDSLQRFKLQEPVICLGGFLKIELLGRAQRNEQDGMYYTCLNHVTVLGHPLSPAFEVALNPTQTETCSSGDLHFTFSPSHIEGVLQRISQPKEENGQNVVTSVAATQQFRNLIQVLHPLEFEFLLNMEELWADLENVPWDDVDLPWNSDDENAF